MRINPVTIQSAEKRFSKFSKDALSTPQMPIRKFTIAQRKCEADYHSIGMIETLSDKFAALVEKLLKVGNLDLAGILCSKLAKFKFLPLEIKEKYIKQGFEIAEFQNDKMHMIARLEDLHREYEKQGISEKLRKVLVREESLLKEVISDFDSSVNNYRTIGDKDKNKDKFQDLLATTQIDLAKVLLHPDPKKAMKKLKSAINILNNLGDTDRCRFAKMLLRMAKENLYGDNYLEF